MGEEGQLMAVRGATTVASDDAEAIAAATAELLGELAAANRIGAGDIVSAIFTTTPDLTAGFPAAGARRIGWGHVPLLGAAEIAVAGAPARCIRVLVHYRTTSHTIPQPVYLHGAAVLRADAEG